jgi:hypothetical protein
MRTKRWDEAAGRWEQENPEINGGCQNELVKEAPKFGLTCLHLFIT